MRQVDKGNRIYIAYISLRGLIQAIHINKPENYGSEKISVNKVFYWGKKNKQRPAVKLKGCRKQSWAAIYRKVLNMKRLR